MLAPVPSGLFAFRAEDMRALPTMPHDPPRMAWYLSEVL